MGVVWVLCGCCVDIVNSVCVVVYVVLYVSGVVCVVFYVCVCCLSVYVCVCVCCLHVYYVCVVC